MQDFHWITLKIAPKTSSIPSQDIRKFTPVSYRTLALWGCCLTPTQILYLDHSKQGIGYHWPCAILGWLFIVVAVDVVTAVKGYLRDTIQTLLWAMFTLIVQEMKEVVSKYMNLHIFLLFMLNKKTYLPEDILNLRKIIYNLVILLVREFDGWHNNHYLHKVFNHYEEVRIMDRCASYKH